MKQDLAQFMDAAKMVVYDQKYAPQFVDLIETQQGAIDAVGGVMGVLDQRKPVPPEIYPSLAVSIYLMMVDVAMAATGEKPDKATMKQTINALLSTLGGKPQGGPEQMPTEQMPPEQMAQPAQPQGMIGAAA